MRPPVERGVRRAAVQRPFGAVFVGPGLQRRVRLGPVLLGCLLLGGALLACEKTGSDKPAALEPCKQVGQRCEYAAGKLGACVLRDGCQGNDCFVCQSQH